MSIRTDNLEPTTGAVVDSTNFLANQPTDEGGARKLKLVAGSLVKTYAQGTEVPANTAYKDREKTKILWTGPLSAVGVPTSLDVGERFSDWDLIIVHANTNTDTEINFGQTQIFSRLFEPTLRFFGSTVGGVWLTFDKLDDTSFSLQFKTLATGNISKIIGVSL